MPSERRLLHLSQQLAPSIAAGDGPRKLVFLGDGSRQQQLSTLLADAHPTSELRVVITESDGYEARHEPGRSARPGEAGGAERSPLRRGLANVAIR